MNIRQLLKSLNWEVLYLKNRVKISHPVHGEHLVCYKYVGGGGYEKELLCALDAVGQGAMENVIYITREVEYTPEEERCIMEKERRKQEMYEAQLTREELADESNWKQYCQVA